MLRYFLILACKLATCANPLAAQNQQLVDSLHNVLEHRSGGERFVALYDLAFEYIHKDNHKALEYIEQAAEAALMSDDSLLIVKSLRVRGQLLYAIGRPTEALAQLEKLTDCPNLIHFGNEYFEVMNAVASCYLFTSRFDKSLELDFQIYQSAKKAGNGDYQAEALANIGFVYYKLKSYDKALDFMHQGLEIADGLGTPTHSWLLNLGLCYAHLGDYDNARHYVEQSTVVCDTEFKNHNAKHAKYASGYIHHASGHFTEAKSDFLASLRLAVEQNDVRMQLDNIYLLAKICVRNHQLDQAEEYLNEAEDIIHPGTPFNLEKIKVFEQLSQLYLAMKNYEKAALYQSQYIRLKDSIYNENVTTSLMNVESQYLESENKNKIAEQAQIIHLNQEVMKRQRQLNVLYAAVAFLTMVIIVFLFRTYCKKRMLNAFLRKKVQERTRELEANRLELEKKASQQQLVLRHAFSGVSGRLATVKGLCLTAREEIADPVARGYVDRIDHVSSSVDEFLRSVLKNGESIKANESHA